MKNQEIYQKVAEKLGIPKELVAEAYCFYWTTIKKTIEKIPMKTPLTEEEFRKYKTNFNLPGLGKLCCTYQQYQKVKQKNKNKSKYYESKKNNTPS